MENNSIPNKVDKKSENFENASDRESSVESFHTNKSELSITTEAELIDVDEIELSDEESWLYQSPKKMPTEDKSISTQKWLLCNSEEFKNVELRENRHALLSKLNQLKNQTTEKVDNSRSFSPKQVSLSSEIAEKFPIDVDKELGSRDLKNSDAYDVVDVHKIARLQEESLKQSTYKFLNNSGKRTPNSRDLSPASPSKPVSVEALNVPSDKANNYSGYSVVPIQSMRKQSLFGSSSAINSYQEIYRGSLPNINKGYSSLKSKKSKHPTQPKVSCPLPIYPTQAKAAHNGSLLKDQRQSSTLPSSYRVNSRRNSSSHREMSSPSPRRESRPFAGSNPSLSNHREYTLYGDNNSPLTSPRRETLPYSGSSSPLSNKRRDSSPYTSNNSPLQSPRREFMPFTGNNSPVQSPRKEFIPHIGNNSPLLNQRRESSPFVGSSSTLPNHRENRRYSSQVPSARYDTFAVVSPTKAQGLRSPPGVEYHREPSHSPSRRLPLSTVQQVSPKKEDSIMVSSKNGDIRALPVKIGSKIPGRGIRSARSVPSTCIPRATDNPWNDDCY